MGDSINETTKIHVLDRLYKRASFCSFCGKKDCAHEGNRHLPTTLKLDDVLFAINLDNHYGPD